MNLLYIWYSQMYKALKSAQNDIRETLLKFVDEIQLLSPQVAPVSPKNPCSECSCNINDITRTLGFISQKQNAQFETLVNELQIVNNNMSNIVSILMKQASTSVDVISTIPTLQPMAHASDLMNVTAKNDHMSDNGGANDAISDDGGPDDGEEDDGAPDDGAPDDGAPDDGALNDAEEDEGTDNKSVESEDKDGIEVEEWTYKGRLFFKDSENTVYANNSGEIGDAIGLYDPVKNLVKKIAIS